MENEQECNAMDQQFEQDWEEQVVNKGVNGSGRHGIIMYDCVDYASGVLALGLSSLTGPKWGGGVSFFNWDEIEQNNGEVVELRKRINFVKCAASVADVLLFDDSQRALVVTDNGELFIISVPPLSVSENYDGSYLRSAHEHHSLISRVAIRDRRAVTASYDNHIKLWEMDSLVSLKTWRAHCAEVLDVAFHPTSSDLFISCGRDVACFLWDSRLATSKGSAAHLPTPQLGGQAYGAPLVAHSLAWLNNENLVVFGDATGRVTLVDIRQESRGFIASQQVHQTRVSRLRARPGASGEVASIGDDLMVGLVTAKELSIQNGEQDALRLVGLSTKCHDDLPHGLCWLPSTAHLNSSSSAVANVLSCGLEPRLLMHSFATSEERSNGKNLFPYLSTQLEVYMADDVKIHF